MKAILVHEFGGPEVLKLEETPTPRPGPGQALVRIHAAGVNPYDTYMRTGNYSIKPPLPYTPGSDGAGVVEAVGEGVTRVKEGDRVYTARTVSGAYAEYALALESQLHPLPASCTFAQGAGVWVPYGTAYYALLPRAEARAGQTLLVHGASGAVGTAAVQIAHAMGLTIIGTAGTEKGREMVKREGASSVFDHTQRGYTKQMLEATGGAGFDVILEMLANVNLSEDLKLLARGGKVVVIGSRGEIKINPRDLMGRQGAILGMTLWGVSEEGQVEINAALGAGLANGTLRPIVGKELPLGEAARAHKEILEPGAFGKMVLVP